MLSTTPEQMRTIQKRYYIPNNSLLIVTGDVHADDVFAKADSLYAGWACGYFCSSARAALMNAAGLTPGRSRTAACAR